MFLDCSGITPTPLGEGKSTTTIGLAQVTVISFSSLFVIVYSNLQTLLNSPPFYYMNYILGLDSRNLIPVRIKCLSVDELKEQVRETDQWHVTANHVGYNTSPDHKINFKTVFNLEFCER